jgi:hypothetical protein
MTVANMAQTAMIMPNRTLARHARFGFFAAGYGETVFAPGGQPAILQTELNRPQIPTRYVTNARLCRPNSILHIDSGLAIFAIDCDITNGGIDADQTQA